MPNENSVKPTAESQTPLLVWQGTLRLFGVDVRCHTDSDGRRIIEANSMKALIEAMADKSVDDPGDILVFARWHHGEPL